jgi:hypothetical protein
MVAIVRRYDPREVERATPPRQVTAPQTSVGALGDALGDLGEAAWTFEDEIATAHAYQIDTEFTQFLTTAMSGDGTENTGYLSQRGLDATGALPDLVESVRTRYQQMVQSLNPRVRPQTVRSMETRYQTFLRQANRHATAQASAGRAAAGAARANASRDAAIRAGIMGDTEAFTENLAAIEATAAELYPNDPDRATAYIREQGSDAHRAVVQGIAAENGASAAWEYVEGNPDVFETGDLWTMRDDYYEGAMTERGAAIADAVVADAILDATARPQAAAETLAAAEDATRLTASRFTDQPLSFSAPEPQGTALVAMADANPNMLDPRQEMVPGGPDYSNLQPLVNETVRQMTPRAPAPAPAFDIGGGVDLSFSLPAPNLIEPPTYVPPDFSAARDQIMQIENPLARQAALQRLEDNIESYEAQMQEVHDQALTQAQEIVLENQGRVGTVDRIPVEIMQHLTPTERETLRGFERTVRQNRQPETPDDVYYNLHLAYEQGDADRLGQLLLQNRHQIAPEQFTSFMARHAAMVAGERQSIDDVQWGSVRTVVDRTMRGFGINPNDDPGTQMMIDNRVSQWIEGQVRRNETVPTQPEIAAFISSQLVDTTINLDGERRRRGMAIEFDFNGSTVSPDDDVTFEMLASAAGNVGMFNAENTGLTINGQDFTLPQLIEARDVLMETLQRAPTMDELWGALTRMAGVQ